MRDETSREQTSRRSWLAQLREAKGLTQTELAALLGVSGRAVQSWELGEAGIRAAHRRNLAIKLGDEVLEYFHAEERQQLATARAEGVA